MIDVSWERKTFRLICRYAWQPDWGGTVSVFAASVDTGEECVLETLWSCNTSQSKSLDYSKLQLGKQYQIRCRTEGTEIQLEKRCEIVVPFDAQVRYFLGKLRRDGWQEISVKVQGALPSGSLALCRGGGYRFPLPSQPKANETYRYLFQMYSEDQAKLCSLVPMKSSPKLVDTPAKL